MCIRIEPKTYRRFAGDEAGTIPMIFALSLVPALTLIGGAVDMSRAQSAQTRMQLVLDAATLAATSAYTSTGDAAAAETALLAFVDAGLAKNGMSRATQGGTQGGTSGGASVSPVTLTNTTFDTQSLSVSPKMTATVGTTMLALAGITSIEVGAKSGGATASVSQQVEVSMMIDLTGSMGGKASASDSSSKIANLKLAAGDFLDILMPSSGDAKARIAIAPFADYVNAGPYAAAATGLASTGTYTNVSNLSSTKNGSFNGFYTGYWGNSQPQGSQHGATSSGGSGATFSNGYCSTPYETLSYYGLTGPKGTEANSYTSGAVRVSSTPYQGYWRRKYDHGYVYYEWKNGTDKWFRPTVQSGCENTGNPDGKLITCVTERSGTHAYDDAAPSDDYVGPYNAGNTNKSNYSSDGKCYVGGRELPSIVPLTNNRSTLDTFFNNATVGGATPGHLGTAWAWYLLSPKWNSVWGTGGQASDYGNARKVVVLMTDGEYNIHYTSPTAKTQALELCAKMKDAGVEVYTVGFGFGQNTVANENGTAEQRAMDLLTKCSSGNNHYYFPYDGTKLREAFKAIGNAIANTKLDAKVRVTQ